MKNWSKLAEGNSKMYAKTQTTQHNIKAESEVNEITKISENPKPVILIFPESHEDGCPRYEMMKFTNHVIDTDINLKEKTGIFLEIEEIHKNKSFPISYHVQQHLAEGRRSSSPRVFLEGEESHNIMLDLENHVKNNEVHFYGIDNNPRLHYLQRKSITSNDIIASLQIMDIRSQAMAQELVQHLKDNNIHLSMFVIGFFHEDNIVFINDVPSIQPISVYIANELAKNNLEADIISVSCTRGVILNNFVMNPKHIMQSIQDDQLDRLYSRQNTPEEMDKGCIVFDSNSKASLETTILEELNRRYKNKSHNGTHLPTTSLPVASQSQYAHSTKQQITERGIYGRGEMIKKDKNSTKQQITERGIYGRGEMKNKDKPHTFSGRY